MESKREISEVQILDVDGFMDLFMDCDTLKISEADLQNGIVCFQESIEKNNRKAVKVLAKIIEFFKVNPELCTVYWKRIFYPSESMFISKCINMEDSLYDELLYLSVEYIDSCLLNVIKEDEEEHTFLKTFSNNIIKLLYTNAIRWNTWQQKCPFILNCFKLLLQIATDFSHYFENSPDEILGLSKAYSFYGLNSPDTLPIPRKFVVSQQALYLFSCEEINYEQNLKGKFLKMRKSKLKSGKEIISKDINRNNYALFEFRAMDSDCSGSESANTLVSKEVKIKSEIRCIAISIIGVVIKSLDQHTIYSYWHALLPNHSEESLDNLLYIALRDTNTRSKCLAIQVVTHILHESRKLLTQAEYDHRNTSFLPFSVNVGLSIENMYKVLIQILKKESSNRTILHALKCLTVLIQGSNLKKINSSIVIEVVQQVQTLISHNDASIQVSVLLIYELLLSSENICDDMINALGFPLNANDFEKETVFENVRCSSVPAVNSNTNNVHSYWLLNHILQNITTDRRITSSVLIANLQVLSAIIGKMYLLKQCQFEQITLGLKNTSLTDMFDVRLYSARCINRCAYEFNLLLLDNNKKHVEECKNFWNEILPLIMKEMNVVTNTIKVCFCDALSNIGVEIFEKLEFLTQIGLISFLSGLCTDNTLDSSIRVAAVRALSIYVTFPSLQENLVYIDNVADLALQLTTEKNLPVRIKLFWAIGNLSDALIKLEGKDVISFYLLKRLIDACILSLSDVDKIRCNSVRAIGNILRLFTNEHLETEVGRLLFQNAHKQLIDCIKMTGSAKVKWNACYAISNFLKNANLFSITIKYVDFNWYDSLYTTIANILVSHSNFKVRINATLIILEGKRQYFGKNFELIWMSILDSMEQTTNLQNFYEYNHRDILQDQLCLALSNCLNCALLEDFPKMKEYLLLKVECIQFIWFRVINRILPEKASTVLSCHNTLIDQLNNSYVTATQKLAINFIIETLKVNI